MKVSFWQLTFIEYLILCEDSVEDTTTNVIIVDIVIFFPEKKKRLL